jgi:hypothetical protein
VNETDPDRWLLRATVAHACSLSNACCFRQPQIYLMAAARMPQYRVGWKGHFAGFPQAN